MTKLLAKNVFTIPAGTPFLHALARFVLDGNHLDTGQTDPFALSRTTIYLPTRRAVRSLRTEFSTQIGTDAALLPKLRTLGDHDDDDIDPLLPSDGSSEPPRVVKPETRQLELARLVKHWVNQISAQTIELFKDDDIIIPSSSAESLWLARGIGELIDQMETEEVSWENLKLLVPNREEYASWWQLTLDFLQIAMKSWPRHLSQIGACDPASYRRQILDIRTTQLRQISATGPIIAAGSTGSIPATARFLRAVSQLPQGTVILPGLDKSMSNDAWHEVCRSPDGNSRSGVLVDLTSQVDGCEDHPQYSLARLLKTIGISRDDVDVLVQPEITMHNRSRLTSISLLPSVQTGHWRDLLNDFEYGEIKAAAKDITIIDAPSERHEAMAIALVLRKQVETPGRRAALVTPDRYLARRVAAELKRFSLNIDDSGGILLENTGNVTFIRLLIRVATQSANSLALASFVKHPFLSITAALGDGTDSSKIVDTALVGRFFEICLLRDALEIPTPGEFGDTIERFRNSLKDKKHIAPITHF